MNTKTWAYLTLGWGLAASLAANVAHAVQEGGTAGAGAVPLAAAVFWPVALLLCSEVLFRVPFRCFADFVAGLAVGTVGLGAGYISFGHTRALLRDLGEAPAAAVLGALAVDGVLVAAGLTLYREAQRVPRDAVPAVPRPAVPAVPRDAVPAVPRDAVPAVPRDSVPAVPRDTVPAVPRDSVPVKARPAGPVPLHAVQGDPVREMAAQGKSVRVIAEELSLSKSTVQRRLRASA